MYVYICVRENVCACVYVFNPFIKFSTNTNTLSLSYKTGSPSRLNKATSHCQYLPNGTQDALGFKGMMSVFHWQRQGTHKQRDC